MAKTLEELKAELFAGTPTAQTAATPAPNDEILKAREILREVTGSGSVKSKPTTLQERVQQGQGQAEQLKSKRVDQWATIPEYINTVAEQYKDMSPEQLIRAVVLGSPGRAAIGLGLRALGGFSQRVEGAGASQIEAFQEGKGGYGKAFKEAVTGKNLAEYGDAFRRAGYNETAAQMLGLGMSSVLDVGTAGKFVGKAARKLTTAVAGKTVTTAATATSKTAMRLFHRTSKPLTDFVHDTKFAFTHPKYSAPEAAQNIVNAIDEQITSIGKHAGSLYDNIKDSGVASATGFTKHKQVAEAIWDVLDNESELGASNSYAKAIGEKFFKKAIAPEKMGGELDNVAQVLRELAPLKDMAKKSATARVAFRNISDIVTTEFEPLAEANSAWKNYSIMDDLFDRLAGKKIRGVDGYFRTGVDKMGKYWTNGSEQVLAKELQKAFRVTGNPFPLEDVLKNLSAAQTFSAIPPSLKPLIIGGYIRAILNAPASVATSVLQGLSLGAASPFALGKMGRGAVVGSAKLRALGKVAEPFMGAADYGIQRQLTGRSE